MITEVCTQYHYVLHILGIFFKKKNIKLALCYMKIGKIHPIKLKFDMHFTIQASQQNFIPLKMIFFVIDGISFYLSSKFNIYCISR